MAVADPDGSGLLVLVRVADRAVQYCFVEEEEDVRASLLPPLPGAQHLHICMLPADGGGLLGTGGRVWRSAPALCLWLQRHIAHGARVIDLGCGTGAVGLYCAALGASCVAVTDASERLLTLTEHNWRRNMAVGATRHASVEPCRLRWGIDEPPAGAFDWVLGSDVIYDPAGHEPLCHTLRSLLRRASSCRIVLATMPRMRVPAPGHGSGVYSDDALVAFAHTASEHGLRVLPVDGDGDADGKPPLLPEGLAWSAAAWSELPPFVFEVRPVGTRM